MDALMAKAIGPIFLLLAVVLVLQSDQIRLPIRSLEEARANVDTRELRALLNPQPLRQPLGSPPRVVINAFERSCSDCHQIFTSRDDTPRRLNQHQHIQVNHGMNSRCFNCHHPTNRDMLTARDGSPLPFAHVEQLCAQCHGTTYRDWQHGMHGKTLGYWDTDLGVRRRLVCTECHDPHAPAFDRFTPLPGPHTLRMGNPPAIEHDDQDDLRNPLRTWSLQHQETAETSHETPESQADHE